ncbi:MAG: hypothetical protein ACI9OJ_005055 [Myxococcota bacterium]
MVVFGVQAAPVVPSTPVVPLVPPVPVVPLVPSVPTASELPGSGALSWQPKTIVKLTITIVVRNIVDTPAVRIIFVFPDKLTGLKSFIE